jgi:hypothetical protein
MPAMRMLIVVRRPTAGSAAHRCVILRARDPDDPNGFSQKVGVELGTSVTEPAGLFMMVTGMTLPLAATGLLHRRRPAP